MKKLTLKEDRFTTITAQTLNPTQAVRETYQIGKNGGGKTKKKREQTIRLIAHENLQKPHIKESLTVKIEALLKKDKTSVENIHKRNIEQDNISASNQALDMYYKLGGEYSPEKRLNINANLTEHNVDSRIEELKQQLDGLIHVST